MDLFLGTGIEGGVLAARAGWGSSGPFLAPFLAPFAAVLLGRSSGRMHIGQSSHGGARWSNARVWSGGRSLSLVPGARVSRDI